MTTLPNTGVSGSLCRWGALESDTKKRRSPLQYHFERGNIKQKPLLVTGVPTEQHTKLHLPLPITSCSFTMVTIFWTREVQESVTHPSSPSWDSARQTASVTSPSAVRQSEWCSWAQPALDRSLSAQPIYTHGNESNHRIQSFSSAIWVR